MLHELREQVLAVYAEMDDHTATFANQYGLRCPPGCGVCCGSEKVEVTLLEMIPLAFALFRSGEAELLIKRLQKQEGEKRCLLYRPGYCRAGQWGCSQYPYRAVVCRLFGVAGNRDRLGRPQFVGCRLMKTSVDLDSARIAAADGAIEKMPLFSEYGMRITALHPGLGTERLPINIALGQTLLKVGMALELMETNRKDVTKSPWEPPDKPLFPISPIRRRAA